MRPALSRLDAANRPPMDDVGDKAVTLWEATRSVADVRSSASTSSDARAGKKQTFVCTESPHGRRTLLDKPPRQCAPSQVTPQRSRSRIARRHRTRWPGPQDVDAYLSAASEYSTQASDVRVKLVWTLGGRGKTVSTTDSAELCRDADLDSGHGDLLPYLHAARGTPGSRARSE
jgi:hypothetical protein